MANATTTLTLNAYPTGIVREQNITKLYGTMTIGASGASYVANGIPVAVPAEAITGSPKRTFFYGQFFSASSGYTYQYDPVHYSVRIFEGGAAVSTPGAELAASALPSAVTSDTIYFELAVANT